MSDAVHRHGELGQGLRRQGPADSRSRRNSRPPTACWCRPRRTAPPTGRRPSLQSATPASSTWAPAAPTACIYLTDTDDHPEGWGGLDTGVGSDGNALLAIDYHTGKVVWRHEWPSGSGITNNLSTAGKLLFTSNGQNLVAFDAANGKILWHAGLMAAPSAGPITYMLDGKQYVLVAAGDSLYAFTVNRAEE